MPSSPPPSSIAVPTQSLVSVLAQLVDPRGRRGRRYPLVPLIAAGIAAASAGAGSLAAIAQWLADLDASVAAALGLDARRCTPTELVLRRLFARIDAELLDAVIGAWMWTTIRLIEGRRVIAVDGKTVGTARTDGAQRIWVAAFDHAASVVLAQVAVAAKTNEIPSFRTLLKLLRRSSRSMPCIARTTLPHSSPAPTATTSSLSRATAPPCEQP